MADTTYLAQVATAVRERIVTHQIDYHEGNRIRLERLHHWLEWWGSAAFLLGLGSAVLYLLLH